MNEYMSDILILLGAASLVYGVSLWSIPSAYVTGGIILITHGIIVATVNARRRGTRTDVN